MVLSPVDFSDNLFYVQSGQDVGNHSKLKKSRNYYRDLYDSAPTAFFTLDNQGLILDVNFTGAELIGVAKSQLINTDLAQHDESLSRTHQGAGIGLSLAKSLVELQGGKIWVESEGQSKGSTFRFILPI